jgi:hypothetical protein
VLYPQPLGEISGSHGGRYEYDSLRGNYAVQCDRSLPTFQTCLSTDSIIKATALTEGVETSETSVNLYHTTRRNIPVYNHLHLSHLFHTEHESMFITYIVTLFSAIKILYLFHAVSVRSYYLRSGIVQGVTYTATVTDLVSFTHLIYNRSWFYQQGTY